MLETVGIWWWVKRVIGGELRESDARGFRDSFGIRDDKSATGRSQFSINPFL